MQNNETTTGWPMSSRNIPQHTEQEQLPKIMDTVDINFIAENRLCQFI
jgi:hypothetical protein